MGSSLDGRVALVTGAGRGIGAAIAGRLAAEGAAVAVNDLDRTATQATVDRIRGSGGTAVAVPGDISEPTVVREIVDGTVGELGGLGVLVNNAGILHRRPFREYTADQWHRVLAVNLSAPFFLTQAAVDPLAASGHGVIVNICSVAVTGFFRQIGYDASKGGLLTLTRSLAVELGREGIRANAVAPGFVDTEIAETGDLAKVRDKTVATLPLPRTGQPHEVADAVAWLASDQSRYVTGQLVHVDGGWFRH